VYADDSLADYAEICVTDSGLKTGLENCDFMSFPNSLFYNTTLKSCVNKESCYI